MPTDDLFSKRSGYAPDPPSIQVREDAPEYFRSALSGLVSQAGVSANTTRSVLCELLRRVPDAGNWSEGNVWSEVDGLLWSCEWYRVYDFIEAIYREIPERTVRSGTSGSRVELVNGRDLFNEKLNSIFVDLGIGWRLDGGRVVSRGEDIFERAVANAATALQESGRTTAASELRHALADLSRRPTPDLTGAIQHAMAACECFVREKTGDPKPTLGELLQKHAEALAIPKPLDQVIEKAWGFASERGRHVREGRAPTREDAELVVALVAAIVNYLS